MADVSLSTAPATIDVDGWPALLVRLAKRPPARAVPVEWAGEWIAGTRDVVHARHAMDGAEFDA